MKARHPRFNSLLQPHPLSTIPKVMSEPTPTKSCFANGGASSDGSQEIINGLRARIVYNDCEARYSRRDKVKLLRAFFDSLSNKSARKLLPADRYVGSIDSKINTHTNNGPGYSNKLTEMVEIWLDVCYPIDPDSDTTTEGTLTDTSTKKPGKPRSLSGGGYAYLVSRLEAIIQAYDVDVEPRESPEEDQLFDALMEDIFADNLSPAATANDRQVARDWLNSVSSYP